MFWWVLTIRIATAVVQYFHPTCNTTRYRTTHETIYHQDININATDQKYQHDINAF